MNAAKIFISYTREDLESANKIRDFLISNFFNVWMDVFDILPGEKWDEKIQEELYASDFILLVLSNNSISKRGYLQKEIRKAIDIADEMLDGDIFLLPIKIDECEIPRKISQYQSVNFYDENGRKDLINALSKGSRIRGLNLLEEKIVSKSNSIDNADLSELGNNKLISFFLKRKK